LKKKIAIIVVLILIVIFGIISFKWIKHRMEYAITNAVFVESDEMTNVGFYRVSGKIKNLFKEEGDFVKKGEVLAKLQDRDFRIELEAIEKKLESLNYKKQELKKKIERIRKELSINEVVAVLSEKEVDKKIEALNQNIKEIDAKIQQLTLDRNRYQRLFDRGLLPKRKLEEVETNLKVLTEKKNSLLKNIEQLKVAKQKAKENIKLAKVKKTQIIEMRKSLLSLKSQIKELEKKKEDIQNKIKYTVLTAPFDGVIAKKFHNVGTVVRAGTPIYSIIKKDSFYIKVLLEETKLKGVKVGNKATIKLDAYPDEKYEGVVKEINPASAAKFALVPRDISAGEFTKIAQRIPVKIKITKGKIELLRVGLGGEVEIKKED
jgi:membrane fusion protein (multidrug efflux system)